MFRNVTEFQIFFVFSISNVEPCVTFSLYQAFLNAVVEDHYVNPTKNGVCKNKANVTFV